MVHFIFENPEIFKGQGVTTMIRLYGRVVLAAKEKEKQQRPQREEYKHNKTRRKKEVSTSTALIFKF